MKVAWSITGSLIPALKGFPLANKLSFALLLPGASLFRRRSNDPEFRGAKPARILSFARLAIAWGPPMMPVSDESVNIKAGQSRPLAPWPPKFEGM